MIEFKQLSEGTPPDIEATTDDRHAELVRMEDSLAGLAEEYGSEFVTARNLREASMEDGRCVFVIPGPEAAEVAEVFDMEGMPELERYLSGLRQEAMDRLAED